MSHLLKALIEDFIAGQAAAADPPLYRTPLVGFASAQDEIFQQLKIAVAVDHLLPSDLLPDARTVLAFFLPFKREVLTGNLGGDVVAESWAYAYDVTNRLISRICGGLTGLLAKQGISSVSPPPTYQFDTERLVAKWSHKHVAYACGLGSFGLNRLLITSKGCGGRFGSAILNVEIEPTPRSGRLFNCLAGKGCDWCLKACPAQALSREQGFDRHRCYEVCRENDRRFPGLDSVEVCGKCCVGPCAYLDE